MPRKSKAKTRARTAARRRKPAKRKQDSANMLVLPKKSAGLSARRKKGDVSGRHSKTSRPAEDLPATRAVNPDAEQDEDYGEDEFHGRDTPSSR